MDESITPITNMQKHNSEHGEMKGIAAEGERPARLLSSKILTYNKRRDKLREKEQ